MVFSNGGWAVCYRARDHRDFPGSLIFSFFSPEHSNAFLVILFLCFIEIGVLTSMQGNDAGIVLLISTPDRI